MGRPSRYAPEVRERPVRGASGSQAPQPNAHPRIRRNWLRNAPAGGAGRSGEAQGATTRNDGTVAAPPVAQSPWRRVARRRNRESPIQCHRMARTRMPLCLSLTA